MLGFFNGQVGKLNRVFAITGIAVMRRGFITRFGYLGAARHTHIVPSEAPLWGSQGRGAGG